TCHSAPAGHESMPESGAKAQASLLKGRNNRYAASVIKHALWDALVGRSDHLLQYLAGAFEAIHHFAGNTRFRQLVGKYRQGGGCQGNEEASHLGDSKSMQIFDL